MAAPCVLISSCSSYNPDDLVKGLLGVSDLPIGHEVLSADGVLSYPWHIETKYYTADISICTTHKRSVGTAAFAESINAVVLVFSTREEGDGIDEVQMWLPYLKELNPPVKILACESCRSDDKISRLKAQEWCLEHGFELVELNPEPQSDDEEEEEEDDFAETVGIERVSQALKSHMWPNLTMKENTTFRSPYIEKLMQEAEDEKKKENEEEKKGEEAKKEDEKQSSDQLMSSLLGASNMDVLSSLATEEEDGADGDNFEKLFAELSLMKESANDLAPDQRRQFAEEMVIKFWRAVGGDEAEIDGLDD